MKSNAWSSRGIWACSAGLAALVLAPAAAAANVTVAPRRIAPGSEALLVFSVADEESVPITRVAVGLPPDFKRSEVETKPGWKVVPSPRTVLWEGSTIRPGRYGQFGLYVQAPKTEERAIFSVLVSLGNGKTLTYHPAIEVQRVSATRDHVSRVLATAALVVAIVAALVALAGGFVAFWLWLRPRPPDAF